MTIFLSDVTIYFYFLFLQISKRLDQNTVFRRSDNYMEDDEPQIKLHNTKLGIATTWNLGKFEERLVQIGEAFRQIDEGICSVS